MQTNFWLGVVRTEFRKSSPCFVYEFEIIDNSPQDLVNAAVEMFSRFDKSDWNMTDQQSNAQNIRLSEGAVGGLPISQSFLDNHQFFVKA